jgi:hypothetical protein
MLAPLLFGNAMMLDDWLPAIVDVTYLLMDPDLAWAAAQAPELMEVPTSSVATTGEPGSRLDDRRSLTK